MKQIKMAAILMLCLGIMQTSFAQGSFEFSLEEAKSFARENNYDIKNALNDIKIAENRVKENIALGLPQINGSVSNNNYFDTPTTLLPDFITPSVFAINENYFGLDPTVEQPPVSYQPVSFVTKYNLTAEVTANQLIFNGAYIIGVKAAKTYKGITQKMLTKQEIDIDEAVSQAYYVVLATEANKAVLDSSITSLKSLANDTREYHKMGFIEDTDADQLELLVSDLEAQISLIENNISISYAYLKWYLGLKQQDSVVLTDDMIALVNEVDYETLLTEGFDHNQHIDFLLLKNQEQLAEQQIQLSKSEYLPSINAFASAQANAMRNEFNFFDANQDWYPTTLWGISMNVPIFASGNRKAKVEQSKLELSKLYEQEAKLTSGLALQLNTARTEFYNSYLVYNNKIRSRDLASRIYQKTQIKYREGLSSSFDLQNAYNQYFTSQTEYILSILDLLEKKLELEKLLTKS